MIYLGTLCILARENKRRHLAENAEERRENIMVYLGDLCVLARETYKEN